MYAFEVGKPYLPCRGSIQPFARYNFLGEQHGLLLCLSQLNNSDVDAVREGEAEFALVVSRGVIFFLYHFGAAIPWSDAPYSWHLVPEAQRELPEMPATAETRALLSVVLVDADLNIVRALRTVTLSPEFTRMLHAVIRAQAARPWSAPAYDNALSAAYTRWKTSEAMLAAAIARTKGGA
jgi:hypothetical protein